jgi:phage terminase large subunit-like protein
MITTNPAGDRKLDKSKTSGRIDVAVALAMACGIADRIHENDDISSFISEPLIL